MSEYLNELVRARACEWAIVCPVCADKPSSMGLVVVVTLGVETVVWSMAGAAVAMGVVTSTALTPPSAPIISSSLRLPAAAVGCSATRAMERPAAADEPAGMVSEWVSKRVSKRVSERGESE